VRTDGFRNTAAFEDKYWQVECGYYEGSNWRSMGVVKLVFHRDYTISVYKDDEFLYKVQSSSCNIGVCPPASRVMAAVYGQPDGAVLAAAPFLHSGGIAGYGDVYVVGNPAALPYYYRYNLTGAYPYRLEVSVDALKAELLAQDEDYYYYNVTYAGQLKLYLGDRLVAYDALYGWTVVRETAQSSTGTPAERPESVCVPQFVKIPKGQVHGNLRNTTKGYYVEVYNVYEVREFGCGVDRTYTERIKVAAVTADGTSYHVYDSQSQTACGFRAARNCGGVVCCRTQN